MARIYEPSSEQQTEWLRFVESRPPAVRNVARQFSPWLLYRIKESGHRVVIYCFEENDDGTVTLKVDVTAAFNALMFERRVFGVKPEDLEECDLPGPCELLGVLLSHDEVDANIDVIRELMTPVGPTEPNHEARDSAMRDPEA
jgi:hypothetical protein